MTFRESLSLWILLSQKGVTLTETDICEITQGLYTCNENTHPNNATSKKVLDVILAHDIHWIVSDDFKDYSKTCTVDEVNQIRCYITQSFIEMYSGYGVSNIRNSLFQLKGGDKLLSYIYPLFRDVFVYDENKKSERIDIVNLNLDRDVESTVLKAFDRACRSISTIEECDNTSNVVKIDSVDVSCESAFKQDFDRLVGLYLRVIEQAHLNLRDEMRDGKMVPIGWANIPVFTRFVLEVLEGKYSEKMSPDKDDPISTALEENIPCPETECDLLKILASYNNQIAKYVLDRLSITYIEKSNDGSLSQILSPLTIEGGELGFQSEFHNLSASENGFVDLQQAMRKDGLRLRSFFNTGDTSSYWNSREYDIRKGQYEWPEYYDRFPGYFSGTRLKEALISLMIFPLLKKSTLDQLSPISDRELATLIHMLPIVNNPVISLMNKYVVTLDNPLQHLDLDLTFDRYRLGYSRSFEGHDYFPFSKYTDYYLEYRSFFLFLGEQGQSEKIKDTVGYIKMLKIQAEVDTPSMYGSRYTFSGIPLSGYCELLESFANPATWDNLKKVFNKDIFPDKLPDYSESKAKSLFVNRLRRCKERSLDDRAFRNKETEYIEKMLEAKPNLRKKEAWYLVVYLNHLLHKIKVNLKGSTAQESKEWSRSKKYAGKFNDMQKILSGFDAMTVPSCSIVYIDNNASPSSCTVS